MPDRPSDADNLEQERHAGGDVLVAVDPKAPRVFRIEAPADGRPEPGTAAKHHDASESAATTEASTPAPRRRHAPRPELCPVLLRHEVFAAQEPTSTSVGGEAERASIAAGPNAAELRAALERIDVKIREIQAAAAFQFFDPAGEAQWERLFRECRKLASAIEA